ncbi:kinase-like protein [Atractiella rhizophila]|nr:kinase-like protein [Atractiella rhizophila]
MDAIKLIKHPHVVELHDWFETEKQFWMAFEPAVGGELYDEIEKRKSFEEWEVRYMIRDLLDAVAHVHSLHIVHRDIKPENIFLKSPPSTSESSGRTKYHLMLADFGVARTKFRLHNAEELITGPPRGSPGYTSPEIYSDTGYDETCDVWACGIIAYILLVGRFPFWELEGKAFVQEARRGFYNPPKKSEECRKFLKAVLEFDMEKRPQAREALQCEWLKEEAVIEKDFGRLAVVDQKDELEQTTTEVMRRGSVVERKESILGEERVGV